MKSNDRELRVEVSRYMSYLLRHNPEDVKMNHYGFIDVDELLKKLQDRFDIDKKSLVDLVDKSPRKRFEIVDNRIRALYGHSLPVKSEYEEDRSVELLYHGTTEAAAGRIIKEGLKPMKGKWVHLSPTKEVAIDVGHRRTTHPVLLQIDVKSARENGLIFSKATDKVYLSNFIPARYIRIVSNAQIQT